MARLLIKGLYYYCFVPPVSNFLPSGNWILPEFMRFEPSFAGEPLTLTRVPGGNVSRLQPRRNMTFGDPPSTPHRSVLPSGISASIYSQECGFTKSILNTLPSMVTVLLPSNSAEKEWCADLITALTIITAMTAAPLIIFLRMGFAPLFLYFRKRIHYIARAVTITVSA